VSKQITTIPYNDLIQKALRNVCKDALHIAEEHGMPGGHHFYIAFNTTHPGVDIPEYLRNQHPAEMTIVMQHQFWGLDITDEYFEVTLSFNKINERLHIPFAALTSFVDPSVQFALSFSPLDEDEGDEDDDDTVLETFPQAQSLKSARDMDAAFDRLLEDVPLDEIPTSAKTEKSSSAPTAKQEESAKTSTSENTENETSETEPKDNVVTLDAFRKK
jgi:hypothetical protein